MSEEDSRCHCGCEDQTPHGANHEFTAAAEIAGDGCGRITPIVSPNSNGATSDLQRPESTPRTPEIASVTAKPDSSDAG